MSDKNENLKNVSPKNNSKQNNSSENNSVVFYNNKSNANKRIPQQSQNDEKSVSISARRAAPKRKLSKKRLVLNIVSIFLAIVFIIAGSSCLVAYTYLNRINYKGLEEVPKPQTSQQTQMQQSSNSQSSLPFVNTYNGDLLNDPEVLNIMIFGDDRRNPDTTGQSDTMILMSIDTRHKKIKLLSFLRDTYVAIPGYENNKINAAYPMGGAALAIQTIEANFGIHIDRYAIIDFNSFTSIIDVLGGIDIELSKDEIDYINWQCWKNHQVETRNEMDINSYTFYENDDSETVAKVHLNSRQALWHARNRGEDGICDGDDFIRTQRQRDVVSIVINELKNSDISTILSIIYEIGPMITTNLKTSEITSLAGNITKYLQYEIVAQAMPEKNSVGVDFNYDKFYPTGWIDPLEIIKIIDWNDFRGKVAEFIYEDMIKSSSETTSE